MEARRSQSSGAFQTEREAYLVSRVLDRAPRAFREPYRSYRARPELGTIAHPHRTQTAFLRATTDKLTDIQLAPMRLLLCAY